MADHESNPKKSIEERQQRQRADLRTELERELSDDAIKRLEMVDELRESGKLGEMIETGDFSDIPDKLRPDHNE